MLLATLALLALVSAGSSQVTLTCVESEVWKNECDLLDLDLPLEVTQYQLEASKPEEIEYLSIKNSTIAVLSNDFCSSFPALFMFNARKQGVQVLGPGAFSNCKKLFYLNLERNFIQALPADIFLNSPALGIVELSHNRIRSLPPNLCESASELSFLELDNNLLTSVPIAALTGCLELDGLGIASNDILNLNVEELHETIPEMTAITFNDNLLHCEKVNQILDTFKELEIVVNKNVESRRSRPYTMWVVEGITCWQSQKIRMVDENL